MNDYSEISLKKFDEFYKEAMSQIPKKKRYCNMDVIHEVMNSVIMNLETEKKLLNTSKIDKSESVASTANINQKQPKPPFSTILLNQTMEKIISNQEQLLISRNTFYNLNKTQNKKVFSDEKENQPIAFIGLGSNT